MRLLVQREKDEKHENSRKALLVIDIQEDYTGVTAKHPFPYKDSEKLITTVNKVIEEASKRNFIIVYIKQEFDGLFGRMISGATAICFSITNSQSKDGLFGRMISRAVVGGTAIKGNPGTEIDKRISIISNHCFSKSKGDAFSNPKLEACLIEYQVNELYLVGIDARFCVYSTAKGALKRGYNVNVITDGIALLAGGKWDALMKKYKRDGINLVSSHELFMAI
ncbi:MAG TPA: isochorismatase family cysteine hydrolase [Anaerolineae bacterium]|nr:isochorismatase family cysteine hydrolase [Anaerolineae bacterium]